jgi:two-component system CheB/CheR fusion protein
MPSASDEIVSDAPISVVGLGASAGGLEAYQQFFSRMPHDSGMAFVLIQHLDPYHASMLPEILQRYTAMPVIEAADQTVVAPNTVYVLPPNRDMTILHGALQLKEPDAPRGLRMPIDTFLRSLAGEQGEWAIGIILSGTGTDGTLGLSSIIGAGGMTLVQEPSTAKHDGMPGSAIQAGLATHVLPVEKMPDALLTHLRLLEKSNVPRATETRIHMARDGIKRLLILLRSATGHDFSLYKMSTLSRRIERRMNSHDLTDIDAYSRYLKAHPGEVQALFQELLINVSCFFRDREAFSLLKHEILPNLLADKPEDYVFRVWVAGCASGEEAYSLAILLREFMAESRKQFKVQIYSTDLDDEAIAVARAGLYPPKIVTDVTPERLQRFFVKDVAGYRIKKEIREMVVFAIQNVIKDPPFTKLDLLSCRNLLIYLEPELQDRLMTAFHYALKPDGVLFLSSSESTGRNADLFAPLNRKWKFYRAVHTGAVTRSAMTDTLDWTVTKGAIGPNERAVMIKKTNFAELSRRVLLESFAPASVITDINGNVLFVHGDTGKYLRPPPGPPTASLVDMAREGLQVELMAALRSAGQGQPVLAREVSVKTNGDFQSINLSVRLLPDHDGDQRLLLVSFQDITAQPPAAKRRRNRPEAKSTEGRVEELERELSYTRENLQSTIEEMQASAEELKSTNEEMQSTNEELQSTNEELETSKEELQSVNEELVTVNSELQAKIEQFADSQNDLKNLMDNINVGTVFLDRHLLIRRFTREATKVYRLIPTDIGRPMTDITSNLQGETLSAAAEAVLETLVPMEREAFTTDGSTYLARIQPYRTQDNVIDGVVLTFTDITKRIEAETAEYKARLLAEGIINTVHEPLLVLEGNMTVISASASFYARFGVTPEQTVGHQIYDLGNRQWDIPALRELLEDLLPKHRSFEGFTVEHNFPVLGPRKMRLNARRVVVKNEDLILLAIEDEPA